MEAPLILMLENERADAKSSTIYKRLNALSYSSDTCLVDNPSKIRADWILKATLEFLEQMSVTHRHIVIGIIDAYCLRIGVQSSFNKDNPLKSMFFIHIPPGLLKEGNLSKQSNLGNGHKFVGYLVHLPGTDEFLAQMNVIGNNAGGWLWSATPELAVRYESLEAAKQISEIYGESAAVKMLWQKDDRYLVTELD